MVILIKCISKQYFGISIFTFISCISANQYYYAIQGIHTNCTETSSCLASYPAFMVRVEEERLVSAVCACMKCSQKSG